VITEERIRKALEKVAVFAATDPAFLPIFEQLEGDLLAVQSRSSALDRAKVLAAQSTSGLSSLAA
jgi:hypothetical protein